MRYFKMYKVYLGLFFGALCLSICECQSEDCVPRDCLLGEWLSWSSCSHSCGENGIKHRKRQVVTEAVCGGGCQGQQTETMECNRRCCPQNCEFSQWSSWDDLCLCSSMACKEPGQRYTCYRFRNRTRDNSCGGTCLGKTSEVRCGDLCCYKDCIVSQWTQWSSCNALCEAGGVRNRSRHVTQDSKCGGKKCPELKQEETCYGTCCPSDCVTGPWGEWGSCSVNCGEGTQTRNRYLQEAVCGGLACPADTTETDTKPCRVTKHRNCKVGPWSDWSQCILKNGYCGAGNRERSREVIEEARCNGKKCPPLTETSDCQGPCCKQACEVSEWMDWSECSSHCGRGRKTRTREIVQQPECGGDECPSLNISVSCENLLTKNCEFSEWTYWTQCDNACGKGQRFRSRTKIQHESCGGTCDQTHLEEKEECQSNRARMDCQVTDWSEWGACQQDCDGGQQTRYRNVTQAASCGGAECPVLMEWHPCHEKCDQLCQKGVCSCHTGYKLSEDGHTCQELTCPPLQLQFCPPGYQYPDSCRYPNINCKGNTVGSSCKATCEEGWKLKGDVVRIHCQPDGEWTEAKFYCGRKDNPPVAILVNTESIVENSEINSCPVWLSTQTQEGQAEKHSYTLLKNPGNRFYLDDYKLCLSQVPDYEHGSRVWPIEVRSTEDEGLHIEQSFSFRITNTNDPPRDLKLFPDTISENSLPDTTVGLMQATDDEIVNQTLRYTLLDTDHKRFKMIQHKNGSHEIRFVGLSRPACFTEGGLACSLNYENKPVHHITVRVDDNGHPPATSYFDVPIKLTDVNDQPEGISLDPPGLPENIKPGETLSKLYPIDEEFKTQKYNYQLLQDPSGLFQINGDSLIASKQFDYEKDRRSKFKVLIKATDNGVPPKSVTKSLTLKVRDQDEPPINLMVTATNAQVNFPPNKPAVRENSPAGTVVGTATVKDQDLGETLTFSLLDGGQSRIKAEDIQCFKYMKHGSHCTAQLVTTQVFDYEDETGYRFTVRVTDKAGLMVQKNLSLSIINVNDSPQDVLINGNVTTEVTVPENHNGFVIGDLSAIDEDSEQHHFLMKDGAGGRFMIEADTLVVSKFANLDYEKQKVFDLIIQVEDNGIPAMSMDKKLTVHVKNLNEKPVNVTLSNSVVPETMPVDGVIGAFIPDDPDNSADMMQQFTYELLDDCKGRFKVNRSNLVVADSTQRCGRHKCILNYEDQELYTIRVNATDNGMPPLHDEFLLVIRVTDANDPPTNIMLSDTIIYENNPIGKEIGVFTADDEDGDQTVTFTLTDHSKEFDILEGNKLIARESFDFETRQFYNITVKASDDAKPSASREKTIDLVVRDRNEPPIPKMAPFVVAENAAPNTKLGKISVADPDDGDEVQFIVTEYKAFLSLGEVTCTPQSPYGVKCEADLILLSAIDHEHQGDLEVIIKAVDKQGLSSPITVEIHVDNANDPPQDILLNGSPMNVLYVDENSQDIDIATLSALDPDLEQEHTFELMPGDDSFELINNTLRVAPDAELDYEMAPVHNLTIMVEDDGEPPLKKYKNLKIHLNDQNDAPKSVSLSNSVVPENSGKGTIVGLLQVEDEDNMIDRNKQLFTCVLTNSDDGVFFIKGNELLVGSPNKLCLQYGGDHCLLNFERQTVYSVDVICMDDGVPSLSVNSTLPVKVVDMNDAPRNITLNTYQVAENAAASSVVAKAMVMDEDVNQTHTFSLAAGSSPMFTIRENGEIIKTKGDRLSSLETFSLTIIATDSGIPKKQVKTTLTLNVGPDTEPPIEIKLTSTKGPLTFALNMGQILENTAPGTVIGQIESYDQDPDESHWPELLHGSSPVFQLVKLDGECHKESGRGGSACTIPVKLAQAVDYETETEHMLMVRCVNQAGKYKNGKFVFKVLDANEPPTAITFGGEALRVHENQNDEVVGEFHVDDPDMHDTFKWELLKDADGIFEMIGAKLKTKAGAEVDFELNAALRIKVKATDQGGQSVDKEFVVEVIEVNEAPATLQLDNSQVYENSQEGTKIGHFVVTDPDNTYRTGVMKEVFHFLLLDDAGGRFVVRKDVLYIAPREHCRLPDRDDCIVDFEEQSQIPITVRVTDSGTPPQSGQFQVMINVLDSNDQPIRIKISRDEIKENQPGGIIVADLSVEDPDAGQMHTFALLKDGDGAFTVEGEKLYTSVTLDYESQSSYEITIQATDNGKPPLQVESVFTIRVQNANEAPNEVVFIPLKSAMHDKSDKPIVGENTAPDTVIGQFQGHDPELNDLLTFKSGVSFVETSDQVVCGEEAVADKEHGESVCMVNVKLTEYMNYEEKPSMIIPVTVTDRDGQELTKSFTLKVVDENDAPTDILANNITFNIIEVPENTEDRFVANLETVDEDLDQPHVYSLLRGKVDFRIQDDELQLLPGVSLDYERRDHYPVVIRTYDKGDPPKYFDKEFIIRVTNMNEPPLNLMLSTDQVPEDSKSGYVIGSLFVDDPDNYLGIRQNFTLILKDTHEGRFKIIENRLEVDQPDFNFEELTSFNLTIDVTDSGIPPLGATFNIQVHVKDANDLPTGLSLEGGSVKENTPIGSSVGHLTASDEDIGQTLSYSLKYYSQLGVRGQHLVVHGDLDYETTPKLNITVVVQDNGQPPQKVEKNFTITVIDMNEPPESISLVPSSGPSMKLYVVEDTPVGQTIGSVKVIDPDSADKVTVKLTDGADFFSVGDMTCESKKTNQTAFTLCSADIHMKRPVSLRDYESVNLTVEATDSGALVFTEEFDILVKNKNDRPTDIIIEGNLLKLPEGRKTLVGALETVDEDINDSHTYTLLDHQEAFHIVNHNKLEVKDPTLIDFEKNEEFSVRIKSTDDGSPPLSIVKEFKFTVEDLNEKPSDILLTHIEVGNNAQPGTMIGYVRVEDPDNDGDKGIQQKHNCTVGDEENLFFIKKSGSNMVLRVSSRLSGDEKVHKIKIECQDDGDPPQSREEQFIIRITDRPTFPKEIRFFGKTKIQENAGPDVIGRLAVVNAISGREIKGNYKFGLANTDVPFKIKDNRLEVAESLDFEDQLMWTVRVTAVGHTEEGRHVIRLYRKIHLDVLDVNEAPTDLVLEGSRTVLENSAPGTLIGSFYSNDPDMDQNHTYTLLAVSPGVNIDKAAPEFKDLFKIQDRMLLVNSSYLNHERAPLYTLQVKVEDNGEPPLSYVGMIRVLIGDVNEPITDIHLSSAQIQENSPVGTEVGEVQVQDEDLEEHITCDVDNKDQVPFKVISQMLVVAKDNVDYEANGEYVVQITCDDGSGFSLTKPLLVNITDINEPPVNVSLNVDRVIEHNKPGELITMVDGIDPEGTEVKFELENTDLPFRLDEGGQLVATETLTMGNHTSYHLNITATDQSGVSTIKLLTLRVVEVHVAPTGIHIDSNKVEENASRGTVVGLLYTSDPAMGDLYTYTLVSKNPKKQAFAVYGHQLVVANPAFLDYERDPVMDVVINCTDKTYTSSNIQSSLHIEVLDVNEPPVTILFKGDMSVPENSQPGTLVTKLWVDDPDFNQTLSCKIENEGLPFVIEEHGKELQLVVANDTHLDFESSDEYVLDIGCDDGQYTVNRIAIVSVEDVNEPVQNVTLTGAKTVPAAAAPGYIIGQLEAADPDKTSRHVFSLTGPNAGLFKVKDDKLLTLQRTIPDQMIAEGDSKVTVNLRVVDWGNPVLTTAAHITLDITDIDGSRLPNIVLSPRTMAEDAPVGSIIGRFRVPSIGSGSSRFKFYFISNPDDIFSIQGDSLILSKIVDFTDGPSHTIVVQGLSSSFRGLILSQEITIPVRPTHHCSLGTHDCSPNAICVRGDRDTYTCTCKSGYVGNGTECSNIDDCLIHDANNNTIPGNPCVNGGECIDDINAFTCKCPDGYSGSHCEMVKVEKEHCDPNPCVHGQCIPTVGEGHACYCQGGYEGTYCDREVDECLSGVCYGSGTCVDMHLTYLCECPEYRTGLRCEFQKDSCLHDGNCTLGYICVPQFEEEGHFCVPDKNFASIKFKRVYNDEYLEDSEIMASFRDFFYSSVKMPQQPSSGTIQKRSVSSPELMEDDQYIYIHDAWEAENKQLEVMFTVLTLDGKPYNDKETMLALSGACAGLDSDEFCPEIEETNDMYTAGKQKSIAQLIAERMAARAGTPVGIILGYICATVVSLAMLCCTAMMVIAQYRRSRKLPPLPIRATLFGDNSEEPKVVPSCGYQQGDDTDSICTNASELSTASRQSTRRLLPELPIATQGLRRLVFGSKTDQPQPEPHKPDLPKPDSSKSDPPKADPQKGDLPNSDSSKPDPSKLDNPKTDREVEGMDGKNNFTKSNEGVSAPESTQPSKREDPENTQPEKKEEEHLLIDFGTDDSSQSSTAAASNETDLTQESPEDSCTAGSHQGEAQAGRRLSTADPLGVSDNVRNTDSPAMTIFSSMNL